MQKLKFEIQFPYFPILKNKFLKFVSKPLRILQEICKESLSDFSKFLFLNRYYLGVILTLKLILLYLEIYLLANANGHNSLGKSQQTQFSWQISADNTLCFFLP